MRLRAQHIRVLRIQLLNTWGDILPEWWPKENVIVVAGRLTSGGYKARLWSTHWSDLEKILHMHRRLPRISLGVILVEFLQTIKILPAQQSVQVRRLLKNRTRERFPIIHVIFIIYHLLFVIIIIIIVINTTWARPQDEGRKRVTCGMVIRGDRRSYVQAPLTCNNVLSHPTMFSINDARRSNGRDATRDVGDAASSFVWFVHE